MRKLKRLLFRLFLFIIMIIGGIMTIKTVNFSSKQLSAVQAIPRILIESNAVERFSKGLQFATVATPNFVDTLVFRQLDTFLQKSYPLTHTNLERIAINEFSYIYKWAGQNPNLEPVLLMGHTDVVPIEEASRDKWTVEPFSGTIKNDKIWSRGAIDDKLNVFGILEASELLLKEGFIPIRTIYFAFGHDEEVSGNNGAIAMVDYFKKNKIQFEYILDEGAMVLSDALKGLDRPLAMIGISEKGYTTLTLTAQLNYGGHSSMPPKETAVGILCKAIDRLQAHPFPMDINGATLELFQHAGPEMNTFYKTLFANLWLTDGLIKKQLSNDPAASALMRTTTAPTMLRGGVKDNVLPTKASAKVNFRIIPNESVASVKAYVQEVIDDKRIFIQADEQFSSNPMPLSSTNSYGFRLIQRTIQEIFPEVVVSPSLVIAATDSRHYKDLSDNIYRFQPIQITRQDTRSIHGIDEHISINNYKTAINFYRQLIKNSGM